MQDSGRPRLLLQPTAISECLSPRARENAVSWEERLRFAQEHLYFWDEQKLKVPSHSVDPLCVLSVFVAAAFDVRCVACDGAGKGWCSSRSSICSERFTEPPEGTLALARRDKARRAFPAAAARAVKQAPPHEMRVWCYHRAMARV